MNDTLCEMVTAEARRLQDEHACVHRSAQQLKNPMFAHPHIVAAFSSKKKIARVLATIEKSLLAWAEPRLRKRHSPCVLA